MTREEQIRDAAFIASMTEETIVREEIVKDGVHVEYKDIKLRDSDRPIARLFFRKGVEWADANQPSPWISVEDRLPEITVPILRESDFVFVHVVNKDTGNEWVELPAKYNINIKDWIAMDFTHIGKRNGMVTHWMPIPELLKEEKK